MATAPASTASEPHAEGEGSRQRVSAAALSPPRRAPIDSAALFAGSREVEIAHGDTLYRLKVTALGKLILTK